MVKKRIIAIILIFIMNLIVVQDNIYAVTFEPNTYKPQSTTTVSGAEKAESIANNIIGPIRVIGSIVSVIALISIGIKYVLGSVEEKAEYKKTMRPYLIGAVMVFAITSLLGVLQDVIGGF